MFDLLVKGATVVDGSGGAPVTTDVGIRDGRIAEPVAEITVAGNLKDMFLNLTPADDLEFRRGTDVFKALALGAKFVFVGRPMLYAVAIGGEAGVRHALTLLHAEVDRDMAMLGCNTVAEITRDCLMDARGFDGAFGK